MSLGGTFSRTLPSFVFSPPILAFSLSPSNVYLFAGDCWWKGRLSVGWRSGAKSAVGRVKGLLCSGTFSLFSVHFPFCRLSFTFSAPSSNVFLSSCCEDFSSVDFSHWRPLFPCFICLPSFCQWTFAGGLSLNAAPWLSPHIPRVTDVLTLTKGHSPGLPASQVPPPPPGLLQEPRRFRFATDRVCHFLGKPSGCHGTFSCGIRPFTSRLTRRKVDTARLWWLDCNWSAHFLSVPSPSWLLNVSLQELK